MNLQEKILLIQEGKKRSQSFVFLPSIIEYNDKQKHSDSLYRFEPLDDDFYFFQFSYTPDYDFLTYEKYGNHHYVIKNPHHDHLSSEGVFDEGAYDLHLPNQQNVMISRFSYIKYFHPSSFVDGEPSSLRIYSIQSQHELRYFIKEKEYNRENFFHFLAQYSILEPIETYFKKQELANQLEQDLTLSSSSIKQPKL